MQRSTLKQYSEYFLVKWLLTFKMFRLRYILKYLTIRLKNSPLAQDHNTPTFYLLFRLTIYYRSWILVDLNTIIFILSFVTFKFSVVFPFFARGQLPPLSIEMVWEVIIIVWFQTVCFALVGGRVVGTIPPPAQQHITYCQTQLSAHWVHVWSATSPNLLCSESSS